MPNDKVQAAEAAQPFVPLAVLENAFRSWWVIALLVVAGALGGLLAHTTRPALYEAVGRFSVAIDYVSTGPLTQYAEDLSINTAGNLFTAADVLQSVVDQAATEGISVALPDVKMNFRLERRFSEWSLRVRDEDPDRARRLAEIWMERGQAALLEGYRHAVQAHQLELYVQSLEACLAKAAAPEPALGACSSARFPEIQQNLRDAGEALYQERLASRGLFSGLTLGPFNPPEVTNQPVTTGQGQFAFLGGMVGLLLGVLLVETGLVARFSEKR